MTEDVLRDIPPVEPVYLRIYRDLLRKIVDGKLQQGDRVPSEVELQQLYEVSRTPVRQALGKLQNEGLISRRRGKGSYVLSPVEVGAWGSLSGFGEYYRDYWDELDCKTLNVSTMQAPADVADSLGIAVGSDVVTMTRLRFFSDEPVVLLYHYLPGAQFDAARFASVGHFFSVRAVLREQFNVVVHSATEDLTAVGADHKTARLLSVDFGTPLLRVWRVSYDWKKRPVQVMRYYVQTGSWHYRANLGSLH